MVSARNFAQGNPQGTNSVGLGYGGRKDKARAMMPDGPVKLHPRVIKEKHMSVTEGPSRQYLGHFAPEEHVPPEKPARKTTQAL